MDYTGAEAIYCQNLQISRFFAVRESGHLSGVLSVVFGENMAIIILI
jgi:hypothetical protein